MEPSGFGGIGQHLQEKCTGSVPWLGASSSCLALMASVVPQDGLTQNSSLASWYNHISSSNQYQYFTPSTNSNVDQSFSMECSRKNEEVGPANESGTHLEKLPMQHFEKQIVSGYSSSEDNQRESFAEDYSGDESDAAPENQSFEHQIAGEYSSCEDDTCPRIHGDVLVAGLEEDNNNQYCGNKSDTVCLNQPIQHNELDVVVGYSSAEDGPCKPPSCSYGAALRQVLKNTKHRWCKWHVLKKLVEMLRHMFNNHKEFSDDFNKVVNHMLSEQEFEDSWAAMVAKYGLSGNPEITRAFESRESNHEEEKNTKQREIRLKFGWPIECHAAKLYTRAAYHLFLEELGRSTAYIVVDSREASVYKVVHGESERREKWSKVEFKVSVDEESSLYDCECGLYNHFGILCCHALLVMVQKGVREIPAIHIMNRWTKSSRFEEPTHLLPAEKPSGPVQSKVLKCNMLDSTLREVAELADSDSESFDFAMKQATSILKKLQEKRDAVRTTCQVGYESSGSEGFRGGTSGSDVFSDSEGRPLQIVDSRSGVAINLNGQAF